MGRILVVAQRNRTDVACLHQVCGPQPHWHHVVVGPSLTMTCMAAHRMVSRADMLARARVALRRWHDSVGTRDQAALSDGLGRGSWLWQQRLRVLTCDIDGGRR
jgi:hypothetical protein